MCINKALVCFAAVLIVCESAFVDTLKKCDSKEHACVKGVMQSVLHDGAKTGIPEYSIPPFDPFHLNNITISVLNVMDVTMIDGIAKGVKDCVVNKFDVTLEKGTATLDMTCDLKIKGKYKVFGNSNLIKNLLGGNTIHGDGNTKLIIDKMHMTFEYHFLVKSKDGDFFIDCKYENLKTTSDIGKMTFAIDSIYLGDNEASGLVVNLLNANWKQIMTTVGKPFIDKAMELVYVESSKFFRVVPTKYYLADDMSPYVTE